MADAFMPLHTAHLTQAASGVLWSSCRMHGLAKMDWNSWVPRLLSANTG